jgi:hypothetical protein
LDRKFLFVAILLILLVNLVGAAPSQKISFQGRLTDENGSAVTSLSDINFSMYDAASGGNLLWAQEKTSIAPSSNGIFSSDLDVTLPFDQDYYLQVAVKNSSSVYEDMSDRLLITRSSYAYRGNISEGLEATQNVDLNNFNISNLDFIIPQSNLLEIDEAIRFIDRANGYLSGSIGVDQYNNILFSGAFQGTAGTITGALDLRGDLSDSQGIFNLPDDLNVGSGDLFINNTLNRIGIGTTSPTHELNVIGDVNISSGGIYADANSGILYSPATWRIRTDGGGNLHMASFYVDNDDLLTFGNAGHASRVVFDHDSTNNRVNVYPATDGTFFRLQDSSQTDILVVDSSSGRVGINVTSPSHLLTVVGDTNLTGTSYFGGNSLLLNTNSTTLSTTAGTTRLNINGSGTILGRIGGTDRALLQFSKGLPQSNWGIGIDTNNLGTDDFIIREDGSSAKTRLVIQNETGYIGIGTSSPSQPLEVDGNVKISEVLIANDSTYLNFDWIGDGSRLLRFFGDGGGRQLDVQLLDGYLEVKTGFVNISAGDLIVGASDLFVDNSAGRVGIGTSSPDEELHLQSGSFMLRNTYGSNNPIMQTSLVNNEIHAADWTAAADAGFLRLSAGGGTALNSKAAIDILGYNTVSSNSSLIRFYTGGTQRAVIDRLGKVGIGTSSPGSATLNVSGWIDAERITLNGTDVGTGGGAGGWTDGGADVYLTTSSDEVGIGTSSPTHKLNVVGDTNITGRLSAAGGSASGSNAIALGLNTEASGQYSTALGGWTKARGYGDVAMGLGTLASGNGATAMGWATNATGNYSTAMGYFTEAGGHQSIAMGDNTRTTGASSIAMGYNTIASAAYATAMGGSTLASDFFATAMGDHTIASGDSSVAMGAYTNATGDYATAMGEYTIASGDYSVALGDRTNAEGGASFALGQQTNASGDYSTAMGWTAQASGYTSIAIGDSTVASGYRSTALGQSAVASGQESTAMGSYTNATGYQSIAMGSYTNATGNQSTAMGSNTKASGNYATAMGRTTTASGQYSIASGYQTYATNIASTALGQNTEASGDQSTAMGYQTTASGQYSTAMGHYTEANGTYSLATGYYADASGTASTAMGSQTTASGGQSIAMGTSAIASGDAATAIGGYVEAGGTASTALGYETNASGNYATAIGRDTLASGNQSTAIGHLTNATGNYAISMGQATRASGTTSTATGYDTTASGNYAITSGYQTTASGTSSTATGYQTTASGDYSTAMGFSAATSNHYATAMGRNTVASGSSSIAIGDGATAGGQYSIAMGYTTAAKGTASTALGYFADANGTYSLATGYYTNASGTASTAIGERTIASGSSSTATGNNTLASGTASTATGYSSVASSTASTAMGQATTASSPYSTAMGYQTTAIGEAATAMGWGTRTAADTAPTAIGFYTNATGDYATAMGRYTVASGQTSTAVGEAIVVSGINSVGVGLDTTPRTVSRDNVMSIMGGRVGIGTTNPQGTLHLNGTGTELRLSANTGGAATLRLNTSSREWLVQNVYSDDRFRIYAQSPGAGEVFTINHSTGDVGIGTTSPGLARLNVSGWIDAQRITINGTDVGSGGDLTNPMTEDLNMSGYSIVDVLDVNFSGSSIYGLDSINQPSGDLNIGNNTLFVDYSAKSVGIGTTSPGQELHVVGDANITGNLNVAGGNASGLASAAIGINTIASGDHSIAMGEATYAEGENSFAFGYTANATGGFAAIAMGEGAKASNDYAVAIGSYAPLASGFAAVAIGDDVEATGDNSFAAGYDTVASGNYATALGYLTNASGNYATAMGQATNATGIASTSMGEYTKASAEGSTAMGGYTLASGLFSTAMGISTTASGNDAVAMGSSTTASGQYSMAQGYATRAGGLAATAIGYGAEASGTISLATGYYTNATGNYSTAMGNRTVAGGNYATAMGSGTTASGTYSTALGEETTASGQASTAMGRNTIANGTYSTAMGQNTDAEGTASTAMGFGTNASGIYSLAAGQNTKASGDYSTAMGSGTKATGDYSTAMGWTAQASGAGSVALGGAAIASSDYSFAMGDDVLASSLYATAMGFDTTASGISSTARGSSVTASGNYSTAMGSSTTASGNYAVAMGRAITASGTSSVGIGLDSTSRTISQSNTMAIMGGNVGINESSPERTLAVGGDAVVNDNLISKQSNGIYFGRTRLSENQWGLNNIGNTWTAKDSSRNWQHIAMSSDGKYQTATVYGGNVYISTDYGNTWTAKDSSRNWRRVAMSSDGKYQTAAVTSGNIYISTDYGSTWTAKDSSRGWEGVAMSSDGKYQTATVASGNIYISTNYGNNWTAKDSSRSWTGVAMSSDGKYQTATVNPSGNIYISTNYGNTWTAKASSGNWDGVAMSSDGKYQTAAITGNIYISTDYGNTWTAKDSSRNWRRVAMSSDGKYQTATVYGGNVYISTDYGNTWTSKASSGNWLGVAMSSDGKYQTAAIYGGNVYASYTDSTIFGNVGIGTVDPGSATLNVSGWIDAQRITLNGTDVGSGGGASGWTDTGATTYLTNTTGLVGIGTSSPTHELNVVGDANITGGLSAAQGKSTVFTSIGTGVGSIAGSSSSAALGYYTYTWGEITGAIALGYQTNATGDAAIAMGQNTVASTTASTAMGYQTKASGSYSTAMGQNTDAEGTASTAMGYLTNASGNYATAMGSYTNATGQVSTSMGEYTVASGYGSAATGGYTTASGLYSTAMGLGTTASGQYSTAMGSSTAASGFYSTARGYLTKAGGTASTALGYATNANGTISLATGYYTNASGQYSTAMGDSTTASSTASTAMGVNTTASGTYSTAMGRETIASGIDGSIAIGYKSESSGQASVAMGLETNATNAAAVAMGNTITVTGDSSVGIGLDATPATVSDNNVMSIMGGKVGIGTVSPGQATLNVSGIIDAYSVTVNGTDVTASGGGWTDSGAIVHLFTNTDQVGIGTASPGEGFNVHDRAVLFSGAGTITTSGANTMFLWYPEKGSIRAGEATVSGEWDDANIGDRSAAFGYATTASGDYSTAMGRETSATGQYSTAMGYQTTAGTGTAAIAMGYSTLATGNYATAMGRDTSAQNDYSTAIGRAIQVAGDNSVGIGLDGTSRTITKNQVMAIVGGNVSIGTVTPTHELNVVGDTNITGILYVNNISSQSPLSLETGGTTRMFIDDSTGYVGIGTTQPAALLDVGGTLEAGQTNLTKTTMTDNHITGTNPLTNYAAKGTSTTSVAISQQSVTGAGLVGRVTGSGGPGSPITLATTNYGLYATADTSATTATFGTHNVNTYGVYANATGGQVTGTQTAYGLYSTASGAKTNWAGYFNDGDVYIKENVGIGTTAPTHELNVIGDVNVTGLFYGNVTLQLPGTYQSDADTDRLFITAPTATGEQLAIGIYDSNAAVIQSLYNDNAGAAQELLLQPFNGKVGIGTTSPGLARLNVSGWIDAQKITINGTDVGSGGGGGWTDTVATTYLTNTSGLVGIGTTSPSADLTVSADSDGLISQFIADDGSDAAGVYVYGFTDDYATTYMRDMMMLYTPSGTEGIQLSTQDASGIIRFSTGGGWNTEANERMRIDSSGNVGIGTSSPTTTLEVTKDQTTMGDDIPLVNISTTGTPTAAKGAILHLHTTRGTGTDDTDLFKVSGSTGDWFTVRNSGKVGIGTTSPGGALLNVTGWVDVQRITINGTDINATGGGGGGGANGWVDDGSVVRLDTSTDKVGINTTSPNQQLTVVGDVNITDGSVLFMGTKGGTLVSGEGTRFMYIPNKGGAIRAGYVVSEWNDVGWYSAAFGYRTKANGTYSFAAGETTSALADHAVALGQQTTASGDTSTAIGRSTTASGLYSIAMGQGITVSGDNSVGIGLDSTPRTVSSNNVMAIVGGKVGIGTTSPGAATLNVSGWIDAQKITLNGTDVGGGSGWTDGGTDVYLTTSTDEVGIGTSSPASKLHIQNGAILANGTTGSTPVSGSGTRFMWIPGKQAFRAGAVVGTNWDNSNIGTSSVAMGYNTKASGTQSTAMGYNTTASQPGSTAMGYNTTASGFYSTAMGRDTTASQTASTAMGYQTTASGQYSTAMSRGTVASGTESTAMGYGSKASGASSLAAGYESNATVTNSIAMGYRANTAGSSRNIAIGSGALADGLESTAIGDSVKARGPSSLALGSAISVSGTNSVGIGLDSTSRAFTQANSMSIMGGDVGIGTTTPSSALEVEGNVTITGRYFGEGIQGPDGIPTQSLLIYAPLDDAWGGQSSTTSDLSGGDNDGTLTGAAWTSGDWEDGKFGKAVELDNNANEEIVFPSSLSLSNNEFTFAAWVNTPGSAASQHIMGKIRWSTTWYGSQLSLSSSEAVSFVVGNGGSSAGIGSAAISTNEWHHVAGTYDGSEMHLYVDGVHVANRSTSLFVDPGSSYPISVNAWPGSTCCNYEGKIDEVLVYNRSLSATEIESIYHSAPWIHRDGGYQQINYGGASPTATDCDSNLERGRMYYDYAANRLYVCDGSSEAWNYVSVV